MLFRNENPVLGPLTQINELGTLASNSTLLSNNFKPTSREVISFPIPASAVTTQWLWQAPWQCQVVAIRVNWAVQSTGASNLSVEKIATDTVAPAASNGTTIVLLSNAVISMQGTANTRQNIALSTASGALNLNAGDQIAVFASATLAGLVGAILQVEIAQLG